ncbi:MAG: endonuclease/exonuclease/phosphatase family protein [Leptonema sp. (in: Bacteria)]|nr:endonuclease/exonuclease/phosphatase family protein [Leptonema sp. (in: bacteria)]
MKLRLLTYNIHKAIGTDRRYEPDRVVEILRQSEADILCLQEVDFRVPRSSYDDIAFSFAEALGFHYTLGLNVFLKRGAYGNAILSRYPILHSENLNITWSIKKPRGCLMSRIVTPAGELAVLNMHLGLAGFERLRQVRMILESQFVGRLGSLPAVFAGDTNDRTQKVDRMFSFMGFRDTSIIRRPEKKSAEKKSAKKTITLPDWKKLKQIGDLKELKSLGVVGDLQTFPSYTAIPLIRIDKMFVSNHFTIQNHLVLKNQKTKVASDHLPLIVDLELKS